MNPFDDAYTLQEIDFYDLEEMTQGHGIVLNDRVMVTKRNPKHHRFVEYLNYSPRDGSLGVPTLMKNQLGKWRVWMSLTWLETQSHFVPVQRATGRVLVGGLGLGYYALRAAAKDDVDEVVVYETDRETTEMFRRLHQDRAELEKIEIVEADFTAIEGEQADFVYNDIYPSHCMDEMLSDARKMIRRNDFGGYHWWTLELPIATYVICKLQTSHDVDAAYTILKNVEPHIATFIYDFINHEKAGSCPVHVDPDPNHVNQSLETYFHSIGKDVDFDPIVIDEIGQTILTCGSIESVFESMADPVSFADEEEAVALLRHNNDSDTRSP